MWTDKVRLNDILPALRSGRSKFVMHARSSRTEKHFNEVFEDVALMSGTLAQLGARPGSKVGILANNRYEWLLLDLACLQLGCTSIPFDRRRSWNWASVVSDFELNIFVSEKRDCAAEGGVSLSNLNWQNASPIKTLYGFNPQEVYTAKFSSGTTSKPKVVLARALHFDHMATHTLSQFPIASNDLYLIVLPLSIYLQRFFLHLCLIAGAAICVGPAEQAVKLLQHERPTILLGMPELLINLLGAYRVQQKSGKAQTLREFLGGRLRYVWTGSAPIASHILEEFEQNGIPIFEGYGMSEIGFIAKNCPDARKLGSVGKPFPGQSIEFSADGEILVRSAYLPNTRYWRGDDENVFVGDQCVRTGDIGRFDDDGFLHLLGRSKDVIALSTGQKILPAPIEKKISASKAIDRCIIFGDGRPYLVAAIVPAPGLVTDGEIHAAIAEANRFPAQWDPKLGIHVT